MSRRVEEVTSTGITLLDAALAGLLIGVSPETPRLLCAIDMREIIRGWDQATVTSICGRDGLKVLAMGGRVVPWPPAVKGLAPDFERCRACWVATGKGRPQSQMMRGEQEDSG